MIDYTGKLVLAPMVRIGELPTRLLALRHGAQLVWGPEIIDKRLLTCERYENTKLSTIDFLSKTGNKKIPGVTDLVFRAYPKYESQKLIFQMGTANPELAVKAASIVIKDVDGIDINAGCPKHFSIHAGMGAALLSTPDLLCDILTSLVEEVGKPNNKPISVKIRLLYSKEESLALVQRLVKTGITNLTLHCRTREMRNRETPIRDYINEIRNICKENKVSFIINGGIKSYAEYKELQKQFGEDVGCMIASQAELNPTCFNKDGEQPWYVAAREFMEFANEVENYKTNTKYCLSRIVPNPQNSNMIYKLLNKAKEAEEISDIILNKMDKDGKYIEPEASNENIDVDSEEAFDLKRKIEETADQASAPKKIKV